MNVLWAIIEVDVLGLPGGLSHSTCRCERFRGKSQHTAPYPEGRKSLLVLCAKGHEALALETALPRGWPWPKHLSNCLLPPTVHISRKPGSQVKVTLKLRLCVT